MAVTTKYSGITPVAVTNYKNTRRGTRASGSTTIYTSTKVTTTFEEGTGLPSYKVEIIEHTGPDDKTGTVIGERDPSNPNKINYNSNASLNAKRNRDAVTTASKSQMNSSEMRKEFAENADDKAAYNLAKGSGNEATEEPETAEAAKGGLNLSQLPPIAGKQGSRSSFDSLVVYPIGLDRTGQDVIKFDMLEYQPKQFNRGGTLGFSERDQNRNTLGSVILPIPSGIGDANAVSFGSNSLNPLDAAVADLALSGVAGGGEGLKGAGQNILQTIAKNPDEAKTGLGAMIAGMASGNKDLLTRATGAVLNPNMELLFQGPSLRPFNFSFKLAARSEAEARAIVKIIRFFKQGMAPIRSESNLFLKSPHTFQLSYKHRGTEDHKFLNKFKECALTSLSVQYAPEGQYATYLNGVPVSYSMRMAFQELEPVFNDQYPDDNDESIGF